MRLKEILGKFSLSASSALIVQASNFVCGIIVMRKLPLYEFGKFSYVFEFMTIFSLLFDGAIAQFLIRDYTLNGTQNQRRNQAFQFLVSGTIFLTSISIAFFLMDTEAFIYVLLLAFGFFLNSMLNQLHFYILSQGGLDKLLVKDFVVALCRLSCYLIAAFILPATTLYFILIQIAVSTLLILFWSIYSRKGRLFDLTFLLKPEFDFPYIGSLIKLNRFLIFLNVVAYVYLRIDVVLLQRAGGYKDVGFYAGATRFFFPLMMISNSFYQAFYPTLVGITDKVKKDELQKKLMTIQFILGMILVVLYNIFKYPFFHLLFGTKYDASIEYLNILILALPILFVTESLNAYYISNKVYKLISFNMIYGLVIIIAAYWFVLKYGAGVFAFARILSIFLAYTILSFKWFTRKTYLFYVFLAYCLLVIALFFIQHL